MGGDPATQTERETPNDSNMQETNKKMFNVHTG